MVLKHTFQLNLSLLSLLGFQLDKLQNINLHSYYEYYSLRNLTSQIRIEDLQKQNNFNNLEHLQTTLTKQLITTYSSELISKMPKSLLSKESGFTSILNSVAPNTDQMVQLLRISLKKQIDRKEKLERLMQKYEQITCQQKTHIKRIKASIIQMKDLQSKSKTKFFLNPIIYVDNHLSKETREYLCMLLNTFYAKYDENLECQHKTKILGKQMNQLLQSISKNQQNLLKIQKQTIGVQVQLQGQLLGHKTKLKDQGQRQKQFQSENKRITGICNQFEDKYKTQLNKVVKLRETCKQLQEKIGGLEAQVAQGQQIKKGKQQMMACQITYQEKFHIQIDGMDEQIKKQTQQQRLFRQRIKQKKLKVQLLKQKYNKIYPFSEDLINVQSLQSTCQTFNQTYPSFGQTCPSFSQTCPSFNQSFTQIKKYQQVAQSLDSTLQMSKSSFSFNQTVKSKDQLNHEVRMKIVQMRNQGSFKKSNERASVR